MSSFKSDHVSEVGLKEGERNREDEDDEVINQSAHILGNYHKYYTFHPVSSRIDLLKGKNLFLSLWQAMDQPDSFSILDIGCNEGDLSLAIRDLAVSELPSHVTTSVFGVDLDPYLIKLAQEKSSSNPRASFKRVDFTDSHQIDAFNSEINSNLFHLVTIFSTTMWIHINHGDSGLQTFFLQASGFLKTNGVMLIEPQPGRCYTNAAKRCRKMGLEMPLYLYSIDKVQINSTIIEMMKKVGLDKNICLGEEEWGRPLIVFHKMLKELSILNAVK